MTRTRPGRPRLTETRRPGGTARAEILDAAAELFSTRGFTSTTTRQIAEAVGVRQASLYHHFTTKSAILVALLDETVAPTVAFDRCLDDTLAAAVRLCALAWFDAAQLCAGRWNLGALYTLPEVRSDEFAPFRQSRLRLASRYRTLSVEVLGCDDPRAELPFRLVESVIAMRADGSSVDAAMPRALAGAAVDVLGQAAAEVVEAARPLVDTGVQKLELVLPCDASRGEEDRTAL